MLKKYGIKTLAILTILLLAAVFAWTHSGGLDQNGGHWDRKKGTYHYHRSRTRTTTPSPTKRTPILEEHRASDIYEPTKLEWLTLQLNAKHKVDGIDGIVGLYLENKAKSAVTIMVLYKLNTAEADIKKVLMLMRTAFLSEAGRYGWQNGIKYEVKKEVLK